MAVQKMDFAFFVTKVFMVFVYMWIHAMMMMMITTTIIIITAKLL